VYLKLDIHHYFETIHHDTIKTLLRGRFKDERLLKLCELIIDRGAPGSPKGRGLPIGNLTSQHLANFYLSHLDRFIKQKLRVKGYLRYMDDLLLFADDFESLRGWREELTIYLDQAIKLKLKERSERLDWVTSGIPFLGLRLYPHTRRFDAGRKRRLRTKLHHLVHLRADQVGDHEVMRAASLYSWASLTDSPPLLRSWHTRWGLSDD
jgi:hypothetical protein